MTAHLARRGLQIIPTILGVMTLVFLMLRFLPGDAAAYIAGENASQDAINALRESLGLNVSVGQQYVNFITNTVQLDLGRSIVNGRPVLSMIGDALPTTLLIGFVSLFLSFVIAVPLGATAAYLASKGKGAFDDGMTFVAMLLDQIPNFWLALVLLLVLSLQLGLVPATGPMEWSDPIALAKRIAIPAG